MKVSEMSVTIGMKWRRRAANRVIKKFEPVLCAALPAKWLMSLFNQELLRELIVKVK